MSSSEDLEAEVHALRDEIRNSRDFLSTFGHEVRNCLSGVPGFADTSLMELAQLGANFDRDKYLGILDILREEQNLQVPEGFEVPEKAGDLNLEEITGEAVTSVDDLRSSWLGRLTEYMLIVYDSATNSISLLQAALDWNRIKAGRQKYSMQRLDPCQIIRETTIKLSQIATEKGLYLNTELEEGLPEIRADVDAMRIVLNNLISNALKYTEEGGVIVTARKKEDGIEIIVSDTGLGIPQEEVPKVFSAFGRVSGQAEKKEGHGLGMAITASHVEAHGGQIWVESEGRGKGSFFYVALPAAEESLVSLVTNLATGNKYFLYNQPDYKDTTEVAAVPKEFIVGITDSYPLTDWVTTFTLPTMTYLTLEDGSKKDTKTVRERILMPTRGELEKRVADLRDRFAQGTLYFMGTDLERFMETMHGLIKGGVLRSELDKEFKAEAVRIVGIAPTIKKGEEGFFQTVSDDPIYRYGLQKQGSYDVNGEPGEFMLYILDDLLESIRDPRNYLDITSFERNVAQKALAIIYANRMSQTPEFRTATREAIETSVVKPLYYLLEAEFKKAAGDV